MKSTGKPGLKVPETVCLQAVGALKGVTACLLHNDPASYFNVARLSSMRNVAVAKASLNRALSYIE